MNASTPLLLALALALIALFAQARVLSSDIDNGKAGSRSVPPTLPVPTLPNSTGADTCGVMENGQVRPVRVVVAITDGYLPVFVNWLLHFRNICPSLSSLYIICLDPKVEKMLPTIGLACATVHHGTKEHSVWTNTMIRRVKMPHHLLQEGYDVLFSDIDAYWIRNPFPTLQQTSSEIQASRGSFPENIGKKLGATLCMGFVYIRGSEHTARLWAEVIREMTKSNTPDDQRDMNNVFMRLGLHYPGPMPTYASSTTLDTGSFVHHNHTFSVTLLPHSTFPRICDPYGADRDAIANHAIIAHCMYAKVGEAKERGAEATGLWRLKKDWDKTPFGGEVYDSYLSSLLRTDKVFTRAVRRTSLDALAPIAGAQGPSPRIVWRDYNQEPNAFHRHRAHSTAHSIAHSTPTSTDTDTIELWYVAPDAPTSTVREFEELVHSQTTLLLS
ncbi:nucleotide-diphospho-sugar transferase-domain-containing protein [Ochromonadaceae sp. CCMP2298]|nr:nucleotide-diphospho-sugar transferase-domain-containing protein [Ochromonadaceae sp. CCMP2298]|mmetsp:Transcript_16040/g.35534  ORF Transcript_16040/g.35534 Transcript_16040/m.35534 type:complete len:443 (+) Transcript_16040:87-1415(+)|eukprot:CAMPEP_0173190190 /NCGR_PEP_ID=MMETSP1141-20130122/12211_1 /TAXON_ID=483371 /ORGANISM="non described non described, Strain CCMP2298" /LENGTH=442 /DNA_ID=CAMNT_0014114279 /DNA_START=10 /DNA_END=1338 /DNA_ORIENTATION=+